MSETRFCLYVCWSFFIYRYKLHDIASARSFQSNACILKVSNSNNSNQDKLKQHFYCFKFLLRIQVCWNLLCVKDSDLRCSLVFLILIQPLLSLELPVFYEETVAVVAVVVLVSLATCSNVFALLTPILENSFTLSLAV
jgi:hypothetical protein